MDITRFGHFTDAELSELRRALQVYISELDWSCEDNERAWALVDELDNERGARFNAVAEV